MIDIALIEKASQLAVVSAAFDWMDIGNFKDLHEAVQRDKNDNYMKGENIHAIDVENVYVRNEEDKPIAKKSGLINSEDVVGRIYFAIVPYLPECISESNSQKMQAAIYEIVKEEISQALIKIRKECEK